MYSATSALILCGSGFLMGVSVCGLWVIWIRDRHKRDGRPDPPSPDQD